ncbi:MAG: helix-turn-helix domain-containing protein [Candidatus Omnitrophica bacterium]|nr:helix-turn-helix domain-containing protein [Candidatus Omnitrophota bacterium]MDD5654305.1 helix-turn-helix domain-containing protein [Candidatus Omnitrophota bacterium]
MSDNGQSCGERLRKARLEKGVSLEEAHKKTKIHLKILEAMEQDSTISMNPVYLRGFLRIYCQFLGLDPQEFIKDIKKTPQDYLPKAKEAVIKSSLKLSLPRPDLKIIKNVAIVLAAAALIVFSVRSCRNWNLTRKAAKDKKTSVQEVVKPPAKAQSAKAASSEPRLNIHARENSWLKIKVDGKTVFEGILKKGQSGNWRGKDKIELNIGNAGGIDLDVNGKTISPLGKKSRSVRHAIVTKEGFEVLK